MLPNYGANDGSLFFPMSDADYRDYRPQLDALHQLLTGKPLYEEALEDSSWVGAKVLEGRNVFDKIEKQYKLISFEKSGYYLIRDTNSLTFIRCGAYKSNGNTHLLHLDVWYKGENVLIDGGSYKYNSDKETIRYFAGTESHNTIMLGDNDQMQKGPRFMWFYPPKVKTALLREDYFDYAFEGSIEAFKQLGEGITVRRQIKKMKGNPEWEIVDTIKGAPADMTRRQLWHTNSGKLAFESDCERKDKTGWYSDYYGAKEENMQVEFVTKGNSITTKIKITE